MRASGLMYEMIILAMFLVLGSNVMIQFVTEMATPMISYTSEKTALDTENTVSWYEKSGNGNSNIRYGKDLLLSLLNTDEYACYPNAIMIDNSPVFKLDMAFQTQKITMLKEIYNPSGQYALGKPERLNGRIKARKLERRDVGGGVYQYYVHYYITTNP